MSGLELLIPPSVAGVSPGSVYSFMPTDDLTTNDRVALQTLLDNAERGGTVKVGPGVACLNMPAHAHTASAGVKGGFGNASLVIPDGVTLDMSADTVLRLLDTVVLSGTQNRIITNLNMNAGGSTFDTSPRVLGGIIDGRAAHVGTGNVSCHGIQFWFANRPEVTGVTVKNVYSVGGSTYEGFGIDYVSCKDIIHHDNVTIFDDGSSMSSGQSANYCDGGEFIGGLTDGMMIQGLTCYKSGNFKIDGLRATSCSGTHGAAGSSATGNGYNFEHIWRFSIFDPRSGGTVAPEAKSGIPGDAPGAGQGHSQAALNFLLTQGGGDIDVVGGYCNNSLYGISYQNAFTTTAQASTASVSIYVPDGVATKSLIGRYVQAASGGGKILITNVDLTTAGVPDILTTATAHGYVSGNTVIITGGTIVVRGTKVRGNTCGVQSLAGAGTTKALDHDAIDLTDAEFVDNSNDYQTLGPAGTATIGKGGGKLPSAITSALVSGTEFYPHVPFRTFADVVNMSAVSTRSGRTGNSPVAKKTANGHHPIDVGGSITATDTTPANVQTDTQLFFVR